MIREFAPAKINLYLHITGRRPNGYHILDSLVAFADVGDEIRLEPHEGFAFALEGPQAPLLAGEPAESNLAVRAVNKLAELTGKPLNAKLTLVKNLPVASGIGGGSSDAAAALRAVAQLWGLSLSDPRLVDAAASCGDDVPYCLNPESCYITESGLKPGPDLPHTDIVLVNPNQPLSTAEVYKNYKENSTGFSASAPFEKNPADAGQLSAMLKIRHNDLWPPALRLMPGIRDVIDKIEATPGCILARMSGSGATCFGLFADRNAARSAAASILEQQPGWWVAQSHTPNHRDRRRN